jgi:hypothetical protein
VGLWSLLAGKHRSGEHSPTDLHKGCAQRGVAGPMPAALSGTMRRGTPPIAAKVCVCAPSSRQAQRPGRLHIGEVRRSQDGMLSQCPDRVRGWLRDGAGITADLPQKAADFVAMPESADPGHVRTPALQLTHAEKRRPA